jgi:hypothetical protein
VGFFLHSPDFKEHDFYLRSNVKDMTHDKEGAALLQELRLETEESWAAISA